MKNSPENFPVRAELVAVCDLREELLEWFAQVPTVQLRTQDHRALLARDDVDAVYVAVPRGKHLSLAALQRCTAADGLTYELPYPEGSFDAVFSHNSVPYAVAPLPL